ncbi:MAG: GNAT family N-acetyltransferase [Ilumatobacter sp.]|nr:GNAT family N-acetyltransferase [Ilumatobacter sp.]
MSADPAALARRLERVEAATQAALNAQLAELYPDLGSRTVEVGGGRLVLNGRHLFVNRLLAGFLDRAPTPRDLRLIRRACASAGLPPAVDLTPATHPRAGVELAAGGYSPADTVSVVFRPVRDVESPAPRADQAIVVDVAHDAELPLWQEISAGGWGHTDPERRSCSDAFAAAWHRIAPDGFFIARDRAGGRPLGCAVMTVADGVATLGGMTTLPDERGRGVQAALIAARIRAAEALGCELVTSTARRDGPSERNLLRQGFRRAYDKHVVTIERPGD